jgi:GNAT superfamily N-acetyltransferase
MVNIASGDSGSAAVPAAYAHRAEDTMNMRGNTVTSSPGNAVAIRALSPDDIDVVVGLSVRAWQPVFDSFRELLGQRLFERFYPDWRVDQATSVRDAIGANTTSVAVVDGTVAGFVNVIIKPVDASGEIYMIAVDPDHQQRGIASALTNWALDEMRRHGVTLATVGTGGDPGHAPARRTYEAAGFTPWPHVTYVKLLD